MKNTRKIFGFNTHIPFLKFKEIDEKIFEFTDLDRQELARYIQKAFLIAAIFAGLPDDEVIHSFDVIYLYIIV